MANRIYHRASLIREDGNASALCFKVPRPINLKIASWTARDSAVTCPKCRAIIDDRTARAAEKAREGQ